MLDSQSGQAILAHLLRAYSPLVIAFSGGLDSRFLAFMAKKLEPEGVKAHLYFFTGLHQSPTDILQARAWAEETNLPFTSICLNPLESPHVKNNEPERCYHCKRFMFQALHQYVLKHPPFPGECPTLCDGSNISDRSGYRPGQRALKELSVHSPLAEAGLGKEDIRALGSELGLDNPDQHARPCLLTRYAYGVPANENILEALGRAEENIMQILTEAVGASDLPSLPDFRLRLTHCACPGSLTRPSDYTAELHLSSLKLPEKLLASIRKALAEVGFTAECKSMPVISGYYDRTDGIDV